MSYSKPPPTSSSDADPSTSTSSLLSAEQRDLVYGQAYSQAVAESDLLEEDDEGELNVVTQTEEAATSEMPDEVFVVEVSSIGLRLRLCAEPCLYSLPTYNPSLNHKNKVLII